MDTRTGRLISPLLAAYISHSNVSILTNAEAALREHLLPVSTPLTDEQKRRGKIGRNELCPCGSGKKFKHCHLRKKTS